MKKIALLLTGALTLTVLAITACNKKQSAPDTGINQPKQPDNLSYYAQLGLDSPYISVDSANVMLESFQSGLSSNDVQSFIVDADALRYYLNNSNIKHLKVMLAHDLDYVHGGNSGKAAGYNANGLTIVIAGFNKDNNYIYTSQGGVLTRSQTSAASSSSDAEVLGQ